MITLTYNAKQSLLNSVVDSPFRYLFLYKRWNGRIYTTDTDEIEVIGDCESTFLSVGDKIIVSSSNDLNVDYTVTGINSTSVDGHTVIECSDLGDVGVNLVNKDFFYKKIDLTEYILSFGDLRKNFELLTYGNIRPSQLNISLLDDNEEYKLTGNLLSPGVLFKGEFVSTISEVIKDNGFTRITTEEHTTNIYDISLFLENNVLVIDGNAKGVVSKIIKVSTIHKYLWLIDDITDSLSVGDKIVVSMQPKFLVKVIESLKEYSNEQFNIFFGILNAKNINKARKRFDLISYSLIKDFDNQYAYQVSSVSNLLHKIPGVRIVNYDIGTKVFEEEKLVKVYYKCTTDKLQLITGCSIQSASDDTGIGARILNYRRPNKFQWDNGSLNTFDSKADNQVLTAKDGSTITVNVNPANYPAIDAEEIVFMDIISKDNNTVLKKGPVGVYIDKGAPSRLLTKFNRIWVDTSYVTGVIADDGGITDKSTNFPIEVIPNAVGAWAVYFSSDQRFGGLQIIGLVEKSNPINNLIWEYSLAYGDDPDCFKSLTIVYDGTDNFTKDGYIIWNIQDDWSNKPKVGDSSDFYLYHIRCRKATSISGTKTVDRIIPITSCFCEDGDIINFLCDYHLLYNDDISDELILRYEIEGDDESLIGYNVNIVPAVWKQCVRVIDIIEELINKSGYGKNKELVTGLLTYNKPILNIWGKPYLSENRNPTVLLTGSGKCDGYIFACFKNAIYRLKGESYEWELIFECDYNYTIYNMYYYNKIFENGAN